MSDIPDAVRNRARKSHTMAFLLSFFLGPLGYVYAGMWGWAVICILTLNFALLGIVIVPLHTWRAIASAKREVASA